MEKFRRPLSHHPLSKLAASKKQDQGWMYFKGPVTFSSIGSQLGWGLHQMMSSVVGLLMACSDVVFLLAHLFWALYEIVASVLSFVLAACHIIWFIIMYSLLIIVRIWEFLFVTLGLVYILLDVCSAVLRGILCVFSVISLPSFVFSVFVGIVTIGYHLRVTQEKLAHNNH